MQVLVNDAIANAVAAMFNREQNSARVFVFDSHVFTELEKHGLQHERVQRLLEKCPSDLLEFEQLFFLVHVGSHNTASEHWILVAVHQTLGHIVAVDSANGKHNSKISAVQRFLEGLYNRQGAQQGAPQLTLQWRGASLKEKTPSQQNGYDCGIFMLVALWCCIRRVPFRQALSDSLTHSGYWRSKITAWLMLGRVTM